MERYIICFAVGFILCLFWVVSSKPVFVHSEPNGFLTVSKNGTTYRLVEVFPANPQGDGGQ